MRTKNTYTSLALSTCLPVIVSVGLMIAPAAQAGKGKNQAPGQSKKVEVCHVNGNGKSKLLSLPLDAALSHMENHDGADFLPTDGDCDQSNDCVLGSTPNEITSGLWELVINQRAEEFSGGELEGLQFFVETTNASVVVPASCSVQGDIQLFSNTIETGEIIQWDDVTAYNYNFPEIEGADLTDLISDEQINACKITLGCD